MNSFLLQNKLAIIIIAFCIPLVLRMIGPNGWYGFRFGRALEDAEQWYEVNRTGAFCVIGTLVVCIVAKQLFAIQSPLSASVQKNGSVIDSIAFGIGIVLTLLMTRK